VKAKGLQARRAGESIRTGGLEERRLSEPESIRKSGYRRRRVHSAGEERLSPTCVGRDSLYFWAPGPRSLGRRVKPASIVVSDQEILLLE